MSLLSKLFGKKENADTQTRIGGMEDFMSLIRVYYQAVIAMQMGFNNLAALPDLRIFKQTLRVPTVNNKLGIGERKRCQKMLMDVYGMSEDFFKEIDASIKRRCKTPHDIQPYLLMFQGFSQELMMLMGNVMQWKLRLPSIFHKALRAATAKNIHQIMTKNDWTDEGVRRTCISVRKYQATLGYSEQWMTEYVYKIVMLAKKEPRPTDESGKKK